MITKKQFVEIIRHLEEVNKFVEETNKNARNLHDCIISDFFNASSLSISFEDDLIKVLDNMFDTEVISVWIDEMEYGKDFKIGDLIDENIKPDLSTAENFYDYLIKSKEGKLNDNK